MIPRERDNGFRFVQCAALAAFLLSPCALSALSPLKLGGALEGRVSDDSGRAQMGAVVQVFNSQDKLIDRQLTDGGGFFLSAGLLPDLYSVRVTLATFLPAIKERIQVEAGKSSLLDVSLSGLFSSIHMLPPASRGSGLLNDDWKWVLRSSSATRPIFRLLPRLPGDFPDALGTAPNASSIFSDSRGLVAFSAGDSNSGAPAGELGTAFAFATHVLGANQLQVAGDVGYGASSNSPSAAFRVTYSRGAESEYPTVSVTARQIYVPRWAASEPVLDHPPLRSVAVNLSDRTEISDSVVLEYGAQFDSVSFGDHLHYFSPYARLAWSIDDESKVYLIYTSGNSRPDLGVAGSPAADPVRGLQQDVVDLNTIAPLTLRSGNVKVQRGENYEARYVRKFGSRDVQFSLYRESVQNAALTLAGADGTVFSGDLIPDFFTDSVLFNAGNYHTMGYTAGITQNLGDNLHFTVTYGSVGVLAPLARELVGESADQLRSILRPGQRDAVTVIASSDVPKSGTHFTASYQFIDNRAGAGAHLYATDGSQPDPGLNISVRQPIPQIFGLPFRMEATADMRNMLAEGYLPVNLANGQRLVLVHTPRSLRGGVNFRF